MDSLKSPAASGNGEMGYAQYHASRNSYILQRDLKAAVITTSVIKSRKPEMISQPHEADKANHAPNEQTDALQTDGTPGFTV